MATLCCLLNFVKNCSIWIHLFSRVHCIYDIMIFNINFTLVMLHFSAVYKRWFNFNWHFFLLERVVLYVFAKTSIPFRQYDERHWLWKHSFHFGNDEQHWHWKHSFHLNINSISATMNDTGIENIHFILATMNDTDTENINFI